MKLTGILVVISMLQVSAATTAQTVTFTASGVPLPRALETIEQQTGYVFFYDTADLHGTRPVTVQFHTTPLREAMKMLLAGQPLDFEIQGTTIVLTKKEKEPAVPVTPPTTAPPPGDVHGRITDSAGNPLEGVNIAVKGTKKGTITSANGDFTLKGIDPDAVLLISSVGYETQTIALKGRTALVLPLKAVSTALGEVQVINKGYYNTTQALNTGSVTVVKGEVIQNQPVSDPIMALEGRVPGLYISQASGVPGASEIIKLRGKNSIANGNDPLYIVDGVPYPSLTLTTPYITGGAVGTPNNSTPGTLSQSGIGMSPFNSLNPSEIESIEVLKDADATSIYGSRGANGVILITTHKGKAGQTKFDVNVYSGVGSIASKMHFLNTHQYLSMRRQAFYNDSIANPSAKIKPGPTDYDINGTWDTTRYTDWQKILIGNSAQYTNAQVTLSGGNVNTQFVIGGGYNKQTTVFPGDFSDQKVSVNVNINHASSDQKFHSQLSAQYINDDNLMPYYDFTQSIALAPDAPKIYNSDGTFNFQNNTWTNPLVQTLVKDKAATNNLIGNIVLGYEILPGLILKSSFGYTYIEMNQTDIAPGTTSYIPSPNARVNQFATSTLKTWIIEPQLSYSTRIGFGKLDALVGTTSQENVQNSFGEIASGFVNDALISDIQNAANIQINGSNYTQYRYEAIYTRIGYNWQDKYILNATVRRDGSSRFGPSRQFGNFGSVGGAWIFSKEKFFQDYLGSLSFGKLRLSYGTTGNDQITDYQYLSAYTSYYADYLGVTGLYPKNLGNPYFGWEVVKKLEAGVDLGFLKDRIFLNISYYRNRTGNQLVGQPLPSIDGYTTVQANLPATVQNSGFEAEFNTINIKSKYFTWNTLFNISIPRNKLISFQNLSTSVYKSIYVIGQPLYIQNILHYTGIDPQKGIYTFQDVNKDGVINSSDYQHLKSINQNYFGGFQNTLNYKQWRLDFLLQFVKQAGKDFLASLAIPGSLNGGKSNELTYVLNNWTNPGDKASIQKYTTGSNSSVNTAGGNVKNSDYIITDASFIRLKNLSLSYSLSNNIRTHLHLQDARVYILAQNLLTMTRYKGFDPETQGVALPPLRVITGGIRVSL